MNRPPFYSSIKPSGLMDDACFQSLAEFFAAHGEKSIKSVFCGGMYLAKYTAHPASVRASTASECAQQGAILINEKPSEAGFR